MRLQLQIKIYLIFTQALSFPLTSPTDKAPSDLKAKEEATLKFQEIAFAYATLSDPIRRKRYDVTGSTSESIQADGDFSWADFYRSQYADIVTPNAIEKFATAYKGSDEERDDVLGAYEKFQGKWAKIYEVVMLSDATADEERFRGYIDAAIESKDVQGYKAYTEESEKQKEARMEKARKWAEREAKEAKAEKIKRSKKAAKKESGLGDLAALIRGRQAERSDAFLDAFAAKWGAQDEKPKAKGKKGKKRVSEDEAEDEDDGMPSEEAFQAAAVRLKGGKASVEASGGRKAKRAKR